MTEEGREAGRSLIKREREKYSTKNGSLQNTSTVLKGTTFVNLKNHASPPVRKDRLSPTSKPRREASRNKFVEKGGMPDRLEALEKSIVERIVRELGLGLLNPSIMD